MLSGETTLVVVVVELEADSVALSLLSLSFSLESLRITASLRLSPRVFSLDADNIKEVEPAAEAMADEAACEYERCLLSTVTMKSVRPQNRMPGRITANKFVS